VVNLEGVIDYQGLRVDPADFLSEHSAYLGFFHWAHLLESAVVAVAVTFVLSWAQLMPWWLAASLGLGLGSTITGTLPCITSSA
jgi:hypothetical protein